MLCKAGKGRASEAVQECPPPGKEKQRGPWAMVRDSVITCCPSPTSPSLYTFHLSGVNSFPDQELSDPTQCLLDWEERSRPMMALTRIEKYTGLWSFPSFFPDFFLGWRSPTINIYLLLKTLTNDLPRRQNPRPTHLLEVLRTAGIGLRFWLVC